MLSVILIFHGTSLVHYTDDIMRIESGEQEVASTRDDGLVLESGRKALWGVQSLPCWYRFLYTDGLGLTGTSLSKMNIFLRLTPRATRK